LHLPEVFLCDYKSNNSPLGDGGNQYPEVIVASVSDETVELFYKYFLNTPVGDKWLCIVVKNLTIDFFIITLYYTDSIKKEERYGKKHNRIF
jgi:hypothetical protein